MVLMVLKIKVYYLLDILVHHIQKNYTIFLLATFMNLFIIITIISIKKIILDVLK
jgi:hypothetical protein